MAAQSKWEGNSKHKTGVPHATTRRTGTVSGDRSLFRFRMLALTGVVGMAVPPLLRAQWPPDSFTNLQTLPDTIRPQELMQLMSSFTRALGVRCSSCHVGKEGRPLAEYDFPSDRKVMKRKARTMLEMVLRINRDHLSQLEERESPPVRVECATCHRGVRVPRPLQDIVVNTYATAGIDSAEAMYRELRRRYYGRAAYDFGDVSLVDAADSVAHAGSLEDALRLHALNLELNSDSRLAQRSYATAAVEQALLANGDSAGVERYRGLHARFGPAAFPQFAMSQLGRDLLGRGRADLAATAFTLVTQAYPGSVNAFTSLGDARAANGQVAEAISAFEKALALDPDNATAKRRIAELRDVGK